MPDKKVVIVDQWADVPEAEKGEFNYVMFTTPVDKEPEGENQYAVYLEGTRDRVGTLFDEVGPDGKLKSQKFEPEEGVEVHPSMEQAV